MFKKLKQKEKEAHSYSSLERMRLVEETKYKNGLGSRNDKTVQISSESSNHSVSHRNESIFQRDL